MLKIYGMPLSSPTNKVRYVANFLEIPFEFTPINLGRGDHKKPEYLKVNPLGRIPAMDDEGFHLGESNAICRYLCDKQQSSLYPQELQQRAIVDQWIDFASQHIMTALGRIMFNTYFYKFTATEKDDRSLQDGRNFINQYLPVIEQQLSKNAFIAGEKMTLADLVMIAALDTCETSHVDLTSFSHLVKWRNKLTKEAFYQKCHENYALVFDKFMTAKA
jgi:glutathione S-transferase